MPLVKQKKITDYEHCGDEYWWAIRLTDPSLTVEASYDIFNRYDKFIVSQEGDGLNTRVHQHIILCGSMTKVDIRAFLAIHYPSLKGVQGLYIQAAREYEQLTKYTVKEGNYKYKGFSDAFVNKMLKLSVPKTDLKKDITANEDMFILGEIDRVTFVNNYVALKIKHNQRPVKNHIVSYVLMILMRVDEYKLASYCRSINEACDYELGTYR